MSPRNSITLDPERGVNPYVLLCEQCDESHSIGLLGRGGYKAECQKCGVINIGNAGQRTCNDTKCKGLLGRKERLREGEYIRSGLCDKCIKSQEEMAEVVKEGGVYWKCSKCNSSGALRATSDISMVVRQSAGIEKPDPVGFDFEGKMCPICEPQTVVEEGEPSVQ